MQNAERRIEKSEPLGRVALFFVLHSAFCVLHTWAKELSVDNRSMQLADTTTITVTLDNDFASLDSIRVPLTNLVFDGLPSVSSDFQWINGQTSRHKVFRYTAHAVAAGGAIVGPVTLHGFGGQVETLAPIAIQVFTDASAGTND